MKSKSAPLRKVLARTVKGPYKPRRTPPQSPSPPQPATPQKPVGRNALLDVVAAHYQYLGTLPLPSMNATSRFSLQTFAQLSLFSTLLEPSLAALNRHGIRLPNATVDELAMELGLRLPELRKAIRFERGGDIHAKCFAGRLRGLKRDE